MTAADTGTIAGKRVIEKQVTGHVDNTAYPAISVDMVMNLVMPVDVKSAPVMILFGGRALAQAVGRPSPAPPPGARVFTPQDWRALREWA
ncbi:MAG: hypothetical protein IBJ03_10845 [Gemmatimonadaceae bacterium]|nr:hypothetical protein [Gemmatimonadaceae bacterium]